MMKRSCSSDHRGIALIIVMVCITVLSIMAAAFAYSMKVETKLAMNANNESELLALGKSGVADSVISMCGGFHSLWKAVRKHNPNWSFVRPRC